MARSTADRRRHFEYELLELEALVGGAHALREAIVALSQRTTLDALSWATWSVGRANELLTATGGDRRAVRGRLLAELGDDSLRLWGSFMTAYDRLREAIIPEQPVRPRRFWTRALDALRRFVDAQ